jgi:hypothetical protein
LSVSAINELFTDNNIAKSDELRLDVDLNINEYLDHAIQDQESKIKINNLLKDGQSDKRLTDFLFMKDNALHFKRHVYLIIGKK